MRVDVRPAPVLRAIEIHRRQPQIKRVMEAADLSVAPATAKSRRVARKIQSGLVLRGIVRG